MFNAVIRKVLSWTISALLIYVPRESVEKEMAALPDMARRVQGVDLHGWTLRSCRSSRTGLSHYYYHLAGSSTSRPLILLHGFNTDGRIFTRLNELSDQFDLYAYNFPEESIEYTGVLDDFVVLLNDFVQCLGMKSAVVAGNSIGGGIALHYASMNTAVTVDALVLLSTSVFGSTEEEKKRYRAMADKLLPYPDYKLFYLLQKGQALVEAFQKTDLSNDAPPEAIVTKKIGWYRQVLNSLYDYEGIPHAQKIDIPVLAIHGSKDRVIPLGSSAMIPRLIPQTRYIAIENAWHSLVYSHGTMVAGYIRTFINQTAPRLEIDSLDGGYN